MHPCLFHASPWARSTHSHLNIQEAWCFPEKNADAKCSIGLCHWWKCMWIHDKRKKMYTMHLNNFGHTWFRNIATGKNSNWKLMFNRNKEYESFIVTENGCLIGIRITYVCNYFLYLPLLSSLNPILAFVSSMTLSAHRRLFIPFPCASSSQAQP